MADYPVDKEILAQISNLTGAQFFEAKDKTSLREIYNEIDRLEKTDVEIQVNALFEDLYQWPLTAALFVLCCEFILSRTRYLKIP
jgi:Ca-activated chloride channel family protein